MKDIQPHQYINIQAFMVTKLKLKGNELLTYAIIHGFTHNEGNFYTASLVYFNQWLGVSKKTALNTLQSLVKKGLIIKSDYYENNVKYCKYYCDLEKIESAVLGGEKITPPPQIGGEKITPPPVKKLHHPGVKITPNNKHYTKPNTKLSIYKENFSFSDFKKEFVKDKFLIPLLSEFGLTAEKMSTFLKDFLKDYETTGLWKEKKLSEVKFHFRNKLKLQPGGAQKSIQFKYYNLEEVEAIKAADPLAKFRKIFIKGKPVFIMDEDFRRYNAEHRFLTVAPQKTA